MIEILSFLIDLKDVILQSRSVAMASTLFRLLLVVRRMRQPTNWGCYEGLVGLEIIALDKRVAPWQIFWSLVNNDEIVLISRLYHKKHWLYSTPAKLRMGLTLEFCYISYWNLISPSRTFSKCKKTCFWGGCGSFRKRFWPRFFMKF